jgi:hypothetical protein
MHDRSINFYTLASFQFCSCCKLCQNIASLKAVLMYLDVRKHHLHKFWTVRSYTDSLWKCFHEMSITFQWGCPLFISVHATLSKCSRHNHTESSRWVFFKDFIICQLRRAILRYVYMFLELQSSPLVHTATHLSVWASSFLVVTVSLAW